MPWYNLAFEQQKVQFINTRIHLAMGIYNMNVVLCNTKINHNEYTMHNRGTKYHVQTVSKYALSTK